MTRDMEIYDISVELLPLLLPPVLRIVWLSAIYSNGAVSRFRFVLWLRQKGQFKVRAVWNRLVFDQKEGSGGVG